MVNTNRIYLSTTEMLAAVSTGIMRRLLWVMWLIVAGLFPSIALAVTINDAEIGSYVVRDGVIILGVFNKGHAGLISGINSSGALQVIDIEGIGDSVAERPYTEFLKTKSTGVVNSLRGLGHPSILDLMTPLQKQIYRAEIRRQAALATGRPYVASSSLDLGIGYLWMNPPTFSSGEITYVVGGIPQVAAKYRCDGLMEWAYEAALAVMFPQDPQVVRISASPSVNPAQGAYPVNNGSILWYGVDPTNLYAGDTSGKSTVSQTVADFPDMNLIPPVSLSISGNNYSSSWTSPYDQSGILEYGYAWVPQANLNSPGLSVIPTTATSVGNQLLPTTAGVYYFVVYAQDKVGHWSTQNGRYQSAAYTVTPVNGICGASNGGSFASMPTANLCSSGTQTTVSGNGPWLWSCNGSNGGGTANCSASLASQPQAIGTISIYPTTLTVGGATQISAASSSGLPVSFNSLTPSVCTVNGSTVAGIASGTCTVAANQAGNTSYSAAPQVTQYIIVSRNSQSIGTINFLSPTLLVSSSTTISATDSSGLAVSYSSTTPNICSVSGNTITGIAAGTCTIAADQAGNTSYSAAPQVTQSITIGLSRDDCLFNWAERTYAQYFSPAGATDVTSIAPYTYRYYSGTHNYLAVSSADNNVYILGPISGNNIVQVGPVTSFLGVSGCQ